MLPKQKETNIEADIIPFPCIVKSDDTFDAGYNKKEKPGTRPSTKMECLYDKEEIITVYKMFQSKIDNADTFAKERIARRNLCMFVCGINIGLRGGDFCQLKWSDIFDAEWNFKNGSDFIPQKTIKHDDNGNIIKCKHINLYWNNDFECAISDYLYWKKNYEREPELEDYIFTSQKGGYINPKEWWKIMEQTRKEAGITQKIGTHGLRKTMAHQYIKNAEDASEALMEVSNQLGHSDLRITQRYACIERERIKENKQRMSFLYE